jgi:GTP cyclohydrolase FolE2
MLAMVLRASTIKCDDEKVVTERAYDNPAFVEDLVRDIAVGLNANDNIDYYRLESENFESIHNHSAYAVIRITINKSSFNSSRNFTNFSLYSIAALGS